MLNNKELADVLRGTGYPYLAHSFTKTIYNEMTEPIPIGMYSRHFKTYEDFITAYNAIVESEI